MVNKYIGVVLGRFAPLHKGHQKVIDQLIEDFGIEDSMIIIGSSTSYNKRTPYTLNERKAMIHMIYPNIQIADIPDINTEKEHFYTNTLDLWLNKLKSMQNKYKADFVFYGGSENDINYLSRDFETKVAFDRHIADVTSSKLSATEIRKILDEEKYDVLENYLNPQIIPLAIAGFKKFKILTADSTH